VAVTDAFTSNVEVEIEDGAVCTSGDAGAVDVEAWSMACDVVDAINAWRPASMSCSDGLCSSPFTPAIA
jgi:hypothetical protein